MVFSSVGQWFMFICESYLKWVWFSHLVFSSFFAVVWLPDKGITKNESQSCWFPFPHVCDLKKVSLVSFLEEIEPTNRFSPVRRLSTAELSLASTWCGDTYRNNYFWFAGGHGGTALTISQCFGLSKPNHLIESLSNLGKMLFLRHYHIGKVSENYDIFIGKVYFVCCLCLCFSKI